MHRNIKCKNYVLSPKPLIYYFIPSVNESPILLAPEYINKLLNTLRMQAYIQNYEKIISSAEVEQRLVVNQHLRVASKCK